jgi:hypothetical protein
MLITAAIFTYGGFGFTDRQNKELSQKSDLPFLFSAPTVKSVG